MDKKRECSGEEKESGTYKDKSYEVVQELGLKLVEEREYVSLRGRLSGVTLG